MEVHVLHPDVDIRDVITDKAVINYGFADLVSSDVVKDVLVRQQSSTKEDTKLIRADAENGNVFFFLIVAAKEEDFLLKYAQHESEEEATMLSPQDDDEILYGVWFDAEIDNS